MNTSAWLADAPRRARAESRRRLEKGVRDSLIPFCLAFLTLLFGAAHAEPQRPIRFDALSLEDGLSQATVNVVFQDAQGLLWIGTEDGLNRFDGYRFEVFKHVPGDPRSLPADTVWSVVEDAAGRLWIGTEGGGVARWDPTTRSFEPLQLTGAAETPRNVRSLWLDAAGDLWVATRLTGLWRVSPETGEFENFRHDPEDAGSLASDEVYVVHGDGEGRVWIGTEAGLSRHDPAGGAMERWRHDPEDEATLGDDRIRTLLALDDGTMLVGMYGGGVAHIDQDGGVRRIMADEADPTSVPHDRVRALMRDADERIWVGTVAGLCLFDVAAARCEVYAASDAPGSLRDSDVMSIYEDRGGLLWFGTRSGGLHRWHPRSWQFGHVAPGPDALSHGTVTGFAEDAAGTLWVATLGGGLNYRPAGATDFAVWEDADSETPASNFIASLLANADGSLWVGTFDQGLLRIDAAGAVVERFRPDPENPDALAAEGVTSLVRDAKGALWIGTFGGGLHRLDDEGITRFGTEQGLSNTRVISLAAGPGPFVWVGTDAGGLNRLNSDTGEVLQLLHQPGDPATLPAETVFSLYSGDPDRLWIGTRGAGLVSLDLDSADAAPIFNAWGEPEGMANDVIYGVQPDDAGRLWLSSNRGLIAFDTASEAIQNFGMRQGLQSDEFTFGGHYRAPSGELYFGGVDGYNAFDPRSIRVDRSPVSIVLTDLNIFGGDAATESPQLNLADGLALDYRQDIVSFYFSALDYRNPRANRFAYRIDGMINEWVELGTDRRVTLTDPAGGTYVLNVRATNADGVWNENGIRIPIEVAPPPWKSPPAYAIYAGLLIAVLSAYFSAQRARQRREAAYARRLETEVRTRTAELHERNDELETANVRLREASTTDSLTGLRNRRFLAEHISEETALVSRRYHLLQQGVERIRVFDMVFFIVDLDGFKRVNDTHGHLAGDEVLLQVRDLLRQSCRQSDILIRWGGDEFLVVARDSAPGRGEELAERIRAAVAEHEFTVAEGSATCRIACSIGFASFPFIRELPDQFGWDDVLMFADTALYAAKGSGKNAWVGFRNGKPFPSDDLAHRIRDDVAAVVAADDLEVLSSIPAGEIRWGNK